MPLRFHRRSRTHRRGATTVEFAVISSVLFLVLIGTFVLGMGVFRQMQMAWLSREAARWAAVRGSYYQSITGSTPPSKQAIIDAAVLGNSFGLDPNKLAVGVTCDGVDWDSSPKLPGSIVTVTVQYQWFPEVFLPQMVLSSSSIQPVFGM